MARRLLAIVALGSVAGFTYAAFAMEFADGGHGAIVVTAASSRGQRDLFVDGARIRNREGCTAEASNFDSAAA